VKKETAFIIAMLVFGIVAGVSIIAILMAIAIPAAVPYLLSVAEKADQEQMAAFSSMLGSPVMDRVLLVLTIITALLCLVLLLSIVNPHIMKGLRNWKSKAGVKLLVVVLALFGWLVLLFLPLGSLFSSGPGTARVVQFFVLVLGSGGLWFAAGETGWAGDYSSWSMPTEAKPLSTILFGLAAGAVAFAILAVVSWTSHQYFILVSEVLDRSGDTSFLGFKLLLYGLVIMLGIAFPILAGIFIALAPIPLSKQERKQRLKLPGVAILTCGVILLVSYGYASIAYDLHRKSLTTILEVPEKASESRTIVVFLPSKKNRVTVQEWPLQVTGYGLVVDDTIEVSEQNLQKVTTYLADHPKGSVFTYAAHDMLVKGYHALWDVKNGLAWQVKSAETTLIHRLLLLARFRYLPVTQEYIGLLDAYADESQWYAGGKSALMISAGYRHFGRTWKAKHWHRLAKERGADLSSAGFMNDPVMTNGIVRGTLLLNGKPFTRAKVALLGISSQRKTFERYKISDTTFARTLVAVQRPNRTGRFVFDKLGSGKYLLALMTDQDSIPASGSTTVAARNVPGVIKLGLETTRNVGVVDVEVSRR